MHLQKMCKFIPNERKNVYQPTHTNCYEYFYSNRVFTEGTCKLLSLVISDLVDEDFVLHGRHQAVSALIFGTSALLSKPGQSFAPLVGSWVLSLQTGKNALKFCLAHNLLCLVYLISTY